MVLDEFQRLHGTGTITKLQSFWDSRSQNTRLKLILAGSSVGIMERIGLSHESPLYGRSRRILKLYAMDYRSSRAFMERFSEEDKVRGYAVFWWSLVISHYLTIQKHLWITFTS